MKTNTILIYILILVIWSCSTQNQSGQQAEIFKAPREMGLEDPSFTMPDPLQYKFDLGNGLSAFIVEGNKAPLVTFKMMVKAGFAHGEKGAAMGMAHILKSRPICSMDQDSFQQMLHDNAFIYDVMVEEEMMVIHLNALAEDFDKAFNLFVQIVKSPCISPQSLRGFTGYPGVNESGMVKTGTLGKAVQLFRQQLYNDHPFDNRLSTSEASRVSVIDVKNYYDQYFVGNNMALAVSGQIQANSESKVKDSFEDLSAGSKNQQSFEQVSVSAAGKTLQYETHKLQTWIVIGQDLPIINPADLPALQVMNYIIGGGHFDTRLYKEARDLRGLTNDASGFPIWKQGGPGHYTFRTYGRPEVADQLQEIVRTEINKIRENPVTEEELFVAQGALSDGVWAMQFENSHTTAHTFAEYWLRYGGFEHLSEYPKRVNAVTITDVQEAARKYLEPDQLITVLLESPSQ